MELFQINMPSIIINITKTILLASLFIIFLISYFHTQETHNVEHRLGIPIPGVLSKIITLHIFVTLSILIVFAMLFML